MIRALSPPISRSAGVLEWAIPEGSAASLSARAILSGKSSLISTNSRARTFFTSLAGIGTMLLAILKGRGTLLEVDLELLAAVSPPDIRAGVEVTTVAG